ncbi:MAG: Arc family DNA-binding protein [Pseudoxanthomonas sp.]|jgi:plasmid stability protein|nr:Arc family DNA-binding protein [Pseudoxanthomonas sp.]HRL52861.1 Arc family DNA-binding protein [Acidovorax temperans]
MAVLTIRNLPEEVHRALRARASQHGRSTEAEVRDILASVVKPETRVRVGDALGKLGRELQLTDADADLIVNSREKTPARVVSFE